MDPVFFADKPAGVTTHTSLNDRENLSVLEDLNDGFCEALSARRQESLFVVHRLDRETSGAIVFARSAECAEQLRSAFAEREVEKRYLFLTDREIAGDTHIVESFIERTPKGFTSVVSAEPNARTRLRKIESSHGISLWEARPETGRPHQIRLHAEALGMPILGDDQHGGSVFAALCLHSEEIRFRLGEREFVHSAPAPIWFFERELIRDQLLIRWLKAADRRARLLRSWGDEPPETVRWIHSEGDPLRVEQLGSVYVLNWFDEVEPNPAAWSSIHRLTETLGWTRWYLQVRGDRGRAPGAAIVRDGPVAFEPRWTATENGLRYEFRRDSGQSPGLFLDQRRNRAWVLANARGKTVLNLFCYTGGFSVAAAAGGATKTVSVDVSKTFLDWARANFELNGLSTEGHEFRAMDSREYLNWAAKKGLLFDLVICDPPSFSRSKQGLFQIDREFQNLARQTLRVTAPGGRVLFSSNYEKWGIDDFDAQAREVAKASGVRLERSPSPDWDFELPRQPRNMKSFFFVR